MKIVRVIILAFPLIIFFGCGGGKLGPISVHVSVTPSVLNSGDYAHLEIEVTNMGELEVEIDRCHVREEITSGPYAGEYTEEDIAVTNDNIDPHETEIIYSVEKAVYNHTGEDFVANLTVTVYSDGGTDSDDCIYTVKPSSADNSPHPLIKTLIISKE